jgi:hypothetical protein
VRFEVIDPDAGLIVAATRRDPVGNQRLLAELIRNVFPGTRRTYASTTDSSDRKMLVIYDLHLVQIDR